MKQNALQEIVEWGNGNITTVPHHLRCASFHRDRRSQHFVARRSKF